MSENILRNMQRWELEQVQECSIDIEKSDSSETNTAILQTPRSCAPQIRETSQKRKHQKYSVETTKRNATSIGLLAFGMTTIMLVFSEFGWEEKGFTTSVQGYGLFYGGLVLFLAGWGELLVGNSFTASTFVTYGAARMTWYFAQHEVLEAGEFETVVLPTLLVNLFLGLFTFPFFVLSIFKKPIFTQVILGTLSVQFFAYCGGEFSYALSLTGMIARVVAGVAGCYGAFVLIVRDEAGLKLPGLRVW